MDVAATAVVVLRTVAVVGDTDLQEGVDIEVAIAHEDPATVRTRLSFTRSSSSMDFGHMRNWGY